MAALPLLVVILLADLAAAEERVRRSGVLTPVAWAESPVPQVMAPELAAFGADHD